LISCNAFFQLMFVGRYGSGFEIVRKSGSAAAAQS
jgi:hypothetical protein